MPPPPGYAAPPPGYAAPPPGYGGPPPGWTPPPKPGLIPLAPLGLGGILGGSFRVLRRNPGPVVGVSLVIHVILALISIGTTLLFTQAALNKYFDVLSTAETSGQLSTSSVSAAISSLLVAAGTGLVSGIFTYAGQAILQGIITTEVARGTLGEKLPLRALWARARGRILPLLGWAGLVIVISFGAFVIVFGGVAILFAVGGATGVIVGGILLVVVTLGAIVIGIWLWTKLSLVPSALVIERLKLGAAVKRSWSLVRGFFWRTFGIELLVAVMLAIAASIIESPIALIITFGNLASNPTGLSDSATALASVSSVSTIVTTAIDAIIATVTAIVTTASTALIYIDLRMRKEGFDLTLMRYVDERAAGGSPADPFLTADSIGATSAGDASASA